MEERQIDNVIRTIILELEDKLMDVLEILSKVEFIPFPVFELEIDAILKEIEYLENLSD